MRYLIALVALVCVGVGIVALATPDREGNPNDRPTVLTVRMVPSVRGKSEETPHKKLRLFTQQNLTTPMGQLARQKVPEFNSAAAQTARLELIKTKHAVVDASRPPLSTNITFNTFSQKADGVYVEMEVGLMFLAGGQPAHIGDRKIKETWVIKKTGDQTECKCLTRELNGPVMLSIE